MNLRKLEVNLNKLYEKIPNDMIKMLLGIFYFRSSFIFFESNYLFQNIK